jgi:hypothetical protein
MGYPRIHGQLLVLGIKVAASTVWEILTVPGHAKARGSSIRQHDQTAVGSNARTGWGSCAVRIGR